jgi:hypothetical protein
MCRASVLNSDSMVMDGPQGCPQLNGLELPQYMVIAINRGSHDHFLILGVIDWRPTGLHTLLMKPGLERT